MGRLPSVVSSVIGGDALGMANYQFAIFTFLIMLALSLLGMLVYRLVCRVHQRRKETNSNA